MSENTKGRLKTICCTCLSVDRKLTKLTTVGNNAVNLFLHFYHNTLASDTLKFIQNEMPSLVICWECKALIRKLCKFREQVSIAQRQLEIILDESKNKTNEKPMVTSLTRLRRCHKIVYDTDYIAKNDVDPLADCKPDPGLMDDLDIPLNIIPKTNINNDLVIVKIEKNYDDSEGTNYETATNYKTEDAQSNMTENKIKIELQTDYEDNNGSYIENSTLSKNICTYSESIASDDNRILDYKTLTDYKNDYNIETNNKEVIPDKINKHIEDTFLNSNSSDSDSVVCSIDDEIKKMDQNNYFFKIRLKEKEFFERTKKLRTEEEFKNANFKCEYCVLILKDNIELRIHMIDFHIQKPNHSQCDICKTFIKNKSILKHRSSHLILHQCKICYKVLYTRSDIILHVKTDHASVITVPTDVKSSEEESMDSTEESSYPCPDCSQVFKSNIFRYKHMQYVHSSSSYQHMELRDVRTQSGDDIPEGMKPCFLCDEMISVDLMRVHARSHVESSVYECVTCEKTFESLTDYEMHLKTDAVHEKTPCERFKFKCTRCSKAFRTEQELKDHTNFSHLKKTRHKCPVCHKALATNRSVTRHLLSVHSKSTDERKRDYMCNTCGKTFLTTKCLEEHERIHTGVRPLSCDVCGRSFRQKAALYTHNRLVHKVPMKPSVELIADSEEQDQ